MVWSFGRQDQCVIVGGHIGTVLAAAIA